MGTQDEPVAVLARAQQDAVWDRVIAHNRLRSLLHEYYPALLVASASKRGPVDPRFPDGRTASIGDPSVRQTADHPSNVDRIVSRKCKARSSRTGRPCGRWASRGLEVCRSHGGATKAARRAAERRIARADALRELGKLRVFDGAREVDPDRVLLAELGRTASAVAWLSGVVGDLDAVDVLTGVHREWWDVLSDERTRLAKLAESASKLGLERQRVDQAERQGAALAAVIRAVLDALDISAEQKARAVRLVPVKIREIGMA